MTFIKQYLARRRLAKMVEQARNTFETQDFARRRAAMLKHSRRTA